MSTTIYSSIHVTGDDAPFEAKAEVYDDKIGVASGLKLTVQSDIEATFTFAVHDPEAVAASLRAAADVLLDLAAARMTHPTCEANLAWPQYRIVFGRIEPMPCHQYKALRTFIDENGTERRFCAAPGHLQDVMRRYGVTPPMSPQERAVYASVVSEGAWYREHEDMPEGEAWAMAGDR